MDGNCRVIMGLTVMPAETLAGAATRRLPLRLTEEDHGIVINSCAYDRIMTLDDARHVIACLKALIDRIEDREDRGFVERLRGEAEFEEAVKQVLPHADAEFRDAWNAGIVEPAPVMVPDPAPAPELDHSQCHQKRGKLGRVWYCIHGSDACPEENPE